MAYASRDDVLARAGRYAGVFTVAGKRPNEADLDLFLEEVSDIIDAEIRARGYDPGLLDADIRNALLDVNAWAVVVRALPSAVPGDDDVDELVTRGDEILAAAGFPSLTRNAGTNVFAVLEALEAGQAGGGAGTSAGSVWDELETEGDEDDLDLLDVPGPFRRGQSL